MQELDEMRDAMLTIRQNLADALRQQCNDRFYAEQVFAVGFAPIC